MPGIPCPRCASTLSDVYDSRPGPGNIVRKRRCFNGHTFETRELAMGAIDPPVKSDGPTLSMKIREALRRGEHPDEIAKSLGTTRRYVMIYVREMKVNHDSQSD